MCVAALASKLTLSLSRLGPDIRMLLLDCRTERKKTQCVSPVTYERVFAAIRALPSRVKHFILLLGVNLEPVLAAYSIDL
jgi:hypothetical protein